MRLVKINLDIVFDNLEDTVDFTNKESICKFLNELLDENPGFFGGFDPENIIEVSDYNHVVRGPDDEND